MAMLAFLAGGDWETPSAHEAGTTSPVTAGADLSTALPVCQPPALFPEHMVGQQEPLFLNIVIPTHVDHDGAVVEAASVRVRQLGGVLTISEAEAALRLAGWPTEMIPAAMAVAYCESKHSPYASGDSGNSLGWFQLNRMWFGYAGEDASMWADPVTNARTALAVYRYEQARGYQPFANWSCRTALR